MATISGRAYTQLTYTVGVPDVLFAPNSSQRTPSTSFTSTVSPYDSSNKYRCDPSSSWCVSLTQYYTTTYDGSETCIGSQSPGYTATWTRLDRSVLASNADLHAGLASASYCSGARYGSDDRYVGSPVPGTSYSLMPYWGTFRADIQNTNFYQCGNTSTHLSRNGSNWDWYLYIGVGGACYRNP